MIKSFFHRNVLTARENINRNCKFCAYPYQPKNREVISANYKKNNGKLINLFNEVSESALEFWGVTGSYDWKTLKN